MGWPLFNTIYKKGFNVTGLDINEELIKSYKNKIRISNYIIITKILILTK